MKKTYIQPTIMVVNIKTVEMIATSVTITGVKDVDYDDNGANPDDAGSRMFKNSNCWEDDELEE